VIHQIIGNEQPIEKGQARPVRGTTPVMLVALLDGRLVSSAEPLLRPDDAGVTRGDGIFETTLVQQGSPRDLQEHLARLATSAAMMDIALPAAADWRRGIDAVLGEWAHGDMVLRLVVTRGTDDGGPTCYLTGAAVPLQSIRQRTEGVRVLLLERGFSGSVAAAAPWLLAGAKTLSYAINMAALRHAAANGAQDAIFVGSDGGILEGPTSTVVVVRGRTLLTPPLAGVLDGITVMRLLRAAQKAGWTTRYQRLTPADLVAADGVLLASSVRLLAPVTHIDGVARDNGVLTAELLALLESPV